MWRAHTHSRLFRLAIGPAEVRHRLENPGFDVAPFMVGAFADVDGNGVRGDGDVLVASSIINLVGYARGDIPQEYTDLGAVEGWNIVVLDFSNTLPITSQNGIAVRITDRMKPIV